MKNLSNDLKKELLSIAHNSIELAMGLEKRKSKSKNKYPKRGAFVTLSIDSRLRGCVGRIEEDELCLDELVAEIAQGSAFDDYRFEPLTKRELAKINIEISVLSKPRVISDYRKIELGKHGVIVETGQNMGVFLPQVAEENNWSLDEFMEHLCEEKAGIEKNAYKTSNIKIKVFEVEKISKDIF